jgi:hypothetical protein
MQFIIATYCVLASGVTLNTRIRLRNPLVAALAAASLLPPADTERAIDVAAESDAPNEDRFRRLMSVVRIQSVAEMHFLEQE